MDTAALVISVLSLVASTISPLILAGAYFIRNIRHSECCNSKVDLEVQDTPNKSKELKDVPLSQ